HRGGSFWFAGSNNDGSCGGALVGVGPATASAGIRAQKRNGGIASRPDRQYSPALAGRPGGGSGVSIPPGGEAGALRDNPPDDAERDSFAIPAGSPATCTGAPRSGRLPSAPTVTRRTP